jgi:predicted secreted hydrolase
MKRWMRHLAAAAAAVIAMGGTGALGGEPVDGFPRITGPCRLVFPRDHGAHPDYRTEWWYYTGNLEAADGRRFGFQFTVFRRRLRPGEPPPAEGGGPRSLWRTRQVFLGHAAVSDIDRKAHHHAEVLARGTPLTAGVEQDAGVTRIFLRDWSAEIAPGRHRIAARGPDFGYRIDLVPEKPPVLHGEAGYSRKGSTAERASCYYSFTRLAASGSLRFGEETVPVTGSAWMDQEFSSAYLEPGLSGWDWLSLQLSDRTEVMVFLLRRAGGGLSPASSGTFVDVDGNGRHLTSGEVALTPGRTWTSPGSGAEYPIAWTLRIPSLDLRLEVEAAFADQEMETPGTTGVTYWEGSVTASGARGGAPVAGRGYLEMTGRTEKGFEAPL